MAHNSCVCATFSSLAHTPHIDVAMQADKNYQKQLQKSCNKQIYDKIFKKSNHQAEIL